MSNLDDIHENGIHDYLKFINLDMEERQIIVVKTSEVWLMSREKAVQIVKEMDHIKPDDLKDGLST